MCDFVVRRSTTSELFTRKSDSTRSDHTAHGHREQMITPRSFFARGHTALHTNVRSRLAALVLLLGAYSLHARVGVKNASDWRVAAKPLKVWSTLVLAKAPEMLSIGEVDAATTTLAGASRHFGVDPQQQGFSFGLMHRGTEPLDFSETFDPKLLEEEQVFVVQVGQDSSAEYEERLRGAAAAQHVLMKWKDDADPQAIQRYIDLVPNMADGMPCVVGVVVYPLDKPTGMTHWEVTSNPPVTMWGTAGAHFDVMLVVYTDTRDITCYQYHPTHGLYYARALAGLHESPMRVFSPCTDCNVTRS
jgi:hypothetical protein